VPARGPAEAAHRPEAPAPGLIERRRTRSSPLVRRIAAEYDIDLSELTGSGVSGRITRRDLEALVGRPPARHTRSRPEGPVYAPGDHVRIEKMSIMRRKIADHIRLATTRRVRN
jgi:2-oxoglutarate dehydrogenase E2 component (dihydrolipoamide succinyltransferase)